MWYAILFIQGGKKTSFDLRQRSSYLLTRLLEGSHGAERRLAGGNASESHSYCLDAHNRPSQTSAAPMLEN